MKVELGNCNIWLIYLGINCKCWCNLLVWSVNLMQLLLCGRVQDLGRVVVC